MSDTEWIPITLADVLSFSNGKTSPERANNLPYPVYGANGVIGFSNAANSDLNTIIIGRVGSYCGSLHFSKKKCWVTDNAIRANAQNNHDARFLFYFLKTLDLNNSRAGSGQPLLNQTILGMISASIPELKEQRAIAHILGSLDDMIELNRQMNETLEAMARAIFQSWFVDFDPVRAKAEGRDTGLPPEVAALFPPEIVDVDGREVPKGWRIGQLSEVIDLIGGGTPQTSVEEYWNGEIPWFSVADAPNENDVFVIDTEKHITQAGVENSSTNILPVGTTIISARGTVGKLAVVGVPMAMNQSCYGIKGRQGYPSYFIHFLVKRAINELQQQTHGTVFETITRQTFDGVEIVIPPEKNAHGFDSVVIPHLEKIRNNLMESRTLAQIRDALLPKLMSGKIQLESVT